MFKSRLGLALWTCASIFLLLSCRSSPVRGPTGSVTPDDPVNGHWLVEYKQARALLDEKKSEPAACALFKKLASEAKFPARGVAEIRSWQACPFEAGQLPDRKNVPAYLNDLALDVVLQLAQARADKAVEMELALEKSRQRLPQSEKVKWTQLALERAHELSLPDREKEIVKRLHSIAPRLNPSPEEKDFLAVANDFRLARMFNQARDYYERIIAGPSSSTDDRISALKGLRAAAKNQRDFEAHLQACARLSEFLEKAARKGHRNQNLTQALYDARTFEARALWTQGRAAEARKIVESLGRRSRRGVSLAELYWLRARMAEERNDFAEVSDLLARALDQKIPDGALREKILWYSAWNERRQGRHEGSVLRLTELEDKTLDEFTRARALFWLGKALADAKKDAESKAAFERLIGLDPLGYYGLLAHRQLGQAITVRTAPDAAASPTAAAPASLDITLADWLAALEERDALLAYLEEASTAYRKQKDQNDDGWVTIFKYYAKAGLYMRLYESLGKLGPERRRSVLENHPDLLYPQPWSEDVRTASLQYGVREELIYSIMRQESAFDPRARSAADAFGLLQVLPEVAEKLSGPNNIPYAQMDDLYEPRTNIHIGAAHLKDLLREYNDQFILTVAAYNANGKAVRNWMRTRFRGDALEFIEEIPYEETRAYVRLVMRNLIFYSLLKSQSASIEFPAWVLKLEAGSV